MTQNKSSKDFYDAEGVNNCNRVFPDCSRQTVACECLWVEDDSEIVCGISDRVLGESDID